MGADLSARRGDSSSVCNVLKRTDFGIFRKKCIQIAKWYPSTASQKQQNDGVPSDTIILRIALMQWLTRLRKYFIHKHIEDCIRLSTNFPILYTWNVDVSPIDWSQLVLVFAFQNNILILPKFYHLTVRAGFFFSSPCHGFTRVAAIGEA